MPPPPRISSASTFLASLMRAARLVAWGRKFQAPQYSIVIFMTHLSPARFVPHRATRYLLRLRTGKIPPGDGFSLDPRGVLR